MYSRGRGVISTQASVTIQCVHDFQEVNDRNSSRESNDDSIVAYPVNRAYDSSVGIRAKELVYQHVNARVGRSGMSKAQPVMSVLNGMYARKNGNEVMVNHEEFLSTKIRFMGVACMDTVFGDAATTQTQLTVRTRGTETIVNYSTVPIKMGDMILWKIPTDAELKQIREFQQGRNEILDNTWQNDQRVLLMTVPYDTQKLDGIDKMLEQMTTSILNPPLLPDRKPIDDLVDLIKKANNKPKPTTTTTTNNQPTSEEVKKALSKVFHQAFEQRDRLDHRKIGRALSSAKPGQPFDILLL